MKRRTFLCGLTLGVLAAPRAAVAQTPVKPWRIGVLRIDSPASEVGAESVSDLRDGLREHGYQDGTQVRLEVRWAEGKPQRLRELAEELVRLPVDVIVTGGPHATQAAAEVTRTIPIVMGRMDDVDTHGIVTNLARPGGNVTGLSFQTGDLSGKWLELLKEAVPKLGRSAVLWDAGGTGRQVQTIREAARSLAVELTVLEVRGVGDFVGAFAAARATKAEAMVMLASPLLTGQTSHLARLATGSRLPAIYYHQRFAAAGGLLAYGPGTRDFGWRRAAVFVDKILKGARPGDLPVEQPTKFELVINSKTAKALGLTIPQTLLLRADQVIE